ncbi:MAG: cytochrome c3 family protein [Methanocella sp.]
MAKKLPILPLGGLWLLVLAGSVAAAPLAGSVHDLSAGPVGGDHAAGATGPLTACSYCHTPHTGKRSGPPLWNGRGTGESFSICSLPEDDPEAEDPAGLSSALCQSCHDGSVAPDAMAAPKYAAGNAKGKNTTVDLGSPVEANLVASLSPTGSHPVGIPYLPSSDLAPAPAEGQFENGVRLIDGRVECASCHNPHSSTAPPFLAASNAGSGLCYTCHVK